MWYKLRSVILHSSAAVALSSTRRRDLSRSETSWTPVEPWLNPLGLLGRLEDSVVPLGRALKLILANSHPTQIVNVQVIGPKWAPDQFYNGHWTMYMIDMTWSDDSRGEFDQRPESPSEKSEKLKDVCIWRKVDWRAVIRTLQIDGWVKR